MTTTTIRGRYGKGWKRDAHDTSKDPTVRHHFGARRGAPPGEASLELYVASVHDQKQTSMCTGFALAMALFIRCGVMGTPIDWPSATAAYTNGRAEERKQSGKSAAEQPLTDDGAQPSLVMLGATEWGVPADRVWPKGGFEENYKGDDPLDHEFVNEEPDYDELEAASVAKVTGYYRIDTEGQERLLDVCHAIAADYPVIIGVEVDQPFEDWTPRDAKGNLNPPATAPDPTGFLGGHMLCIVGYRTNAVTGRKEYRICNSWGVNPGDNGFWWCDEAWLTDTNAGDLFVITVSAMAA